VDGRVEGWRGLRGWIDVEMDGEIGWMGMDGWVGEWVCG